jgi:hypothetical protein
MLALALSTLLLPGLALAAPLTARQEAGSSKIRFQSSDFVSSLSCRRIPSSLTS